MMVTMPAVPEVMAARDTMAVTEMMAARAVTPMPEMMAVRAVTPVPEMMAARDMTAVSEMMPARGLVPMPHVPGPHMTAVPDRVPGRVAGRDTMAVTEMMPARDLMTMRVSATTSGCQSASRANCAAQESQREQHGVQHLRPGTRSLIAGCIEH